MLCNLTNDWSLCDCPQNWTFCIEAVGYFRKENLKDDKKELGRIIE